MWDQHTIVTPQMIKMNENHIDGLTILTAILLNGSISFSACLQGRFYT